MVLVNLFLAGFNKCGSSTMSVLLDRHPDVLMPTITEPWHFVRPDYEQRWAAYEGCYPHWQQYPIVCDDSMSYSSRPQRGVPPETVVHRIYRHNPRARFLFIARDPVARIESAFRELHDTGVRYGVLAPFDLGEAMEQLPALVNDSCYAEGLQPFTDTFGPDRIHLLYLEDLVADPGATMAPVWRFLGLDAPREGRGGLPRENAGAAKIRDTAVLRALRTNRWAGPRLARVDIKTQDRYLTRVGLRRRARGAIEWSDRAVAEVAERVWPDAQRLWRAHGEPHGGWPRLRELVGAGRHRPEPGSVA